MIQDSGPIAPTGGRLARWQIAFLIILGLVIFWPGQSNLPPTDRDEGRYIQATVQMLESGDFIDIRYQDQPRYLQPAGVYWTQAASVALLSDAEEREVWAHRVPSYLAAVAVLVVVAWIGTMLFSPATGMLGAILLACTVLLGVEARLAKTDAQLLLTICLAMAALVRVYLDRQAAQPPAWWTTILFWAALGAGLMIKGPIILLVVGTTLAALILVERRVGWLWRLRPWIGVLITLAIAAPWYIAIYQVSDGAFFARAGGQNMLEKIFTGQQSHGFPPGYFLLLASVTFWPASLFLALGLPWIWRERRQPAVRLLLAWVIPTWLIYEIIVTKLPHYVLPVYPALALLAAAAAMGLTERLVRGGGWARLFWPFAAIWWVIGAALALGPPILVIVLEDRVPLFGTLIGLIGAVAIGWWALMLRRARPDRMGFVLPLPVLFVLGAAFGLNVPQLETIWLSPRLAEATAATAEAQLEECPAVRIYSAPYDEPSFVFLTQTDTQLGHAQSLAGAVAEAPDCAILVLGEAEQAVVEATLAERGLRLAEQAAVTGLNYSNGDWLDLTVATVRPETPE